MWLIWIVWVSLVKCTGSITFISAKSGWDSVIWILILSLSARAWIMRLSHHVPCCDIFVRYSNQEFSLLLSINLSGCSLKKSTPRALMFKWKLGSPYNWCATARKKQSPPPPTSSGLSPCLCNLVVNKMLLSCGEKQIDLLITFSAGLGFISMSPDSKSFISDAEYCLLLKFFQQFLCACDNLDRK